MKGYGVINEAEVQVGQNSFINTVSFALLRSQICRISDGKVYRTEKICLKVQSKNSPIPSHTTKKKKKKKRKKGKEKKERKEKEKEKKWKKEKKKRHVHTLF